MAGTFLNSDPFVVMDSRAIAEYVRSPSGPLFMYEMELAQRVEDLAKQQVGYSTDKPAGEEGGEHLRDTIVKRIVEGPDGPEILVGSAHPRARLHHEGTVAHEIVPVKAKVLSFMVGGIRVFARRVLHPGTAANHFLTDPLEQVMREESSRAA